MAAAKSEGIHMSTALITGATSGIGLAFARTLARRGHDIVLVARDRERLNLVASELRGNRVCVEVLAADLTDRVQLGSVEDYLRTHPVEILVNNAGFGVPQRFSSGDLDAEQQMLDVLVTAVMRLTHAALPGMVARASGAVLNVSSVASWITGGTYSASKAWVTVFSESLAIELAGTGVHVTAVCPGFTHTEFHQRASMEMDALPEWMWLDPQEVVDRALADVRKGRPVSVAGPQYKVLSLAAQYLPRPLVRTIGSRRPGGQSRAR
jgi:short-subunit dehydrogenase